MEGWLLNCFFLSFSNRENYSNKGISVYTIKAWSKIKTKVTGKQNLAHFKMTIQIFFIHNFCNNSKMLLSSSWAIFVQKCYCHPPGQYLLERLCFGLHQVPTFLRLSTCVFRFYWFLDLFLFSTQELKQKNNYIIIKIEKFQLCVIICFDTATQSRSFFIQLEPTEQRLRIFEQKITCDGKF